MTLTGAELAANYKAYAEAMLDGTYEGYVFDVQGGFNTIDPLYAVKMLRREISIDDKEELCRRLILNKTVSITLYGELVVEFMLPNLETGFYAYDAFVRNPSSLSFLISAVYSVFLKNSVPQLTVSQAAARKTLREKKIAELQGASLASSKKD